MTKSEIKTVICKLNILIVKYKSDNTTDRQKRIINRFKGDLNYFNTILIQEIANETRLNKKSL